MKVLIDVNVILDLLLNRSPWASDAAALWDAHVHKQIDAYLAAFALPTIHYVVKRQSDLATALSAVEKCLLTLQIAATERAALEAALKMAGADFEDNLQIACAVNAGLQAIVTRDAKGFSHSPIPVYTTSDAVALLLKPGAPSP